MRKSWNRSGIIAAGNWIVDHLKLIDIYPVQDSLANIEEEHLSNGGSAYNILKDLAKLGAPFPLKAVGLLGADGYADIIRKDCATLNIDTCSLRTISDRPTSYTDVMIVKGSGRRTFFHNRGTNALLDVQHFDFADSKEKIFHLGYLLLLDSLDKIDESGSTGGALVLQKACDSGLRTSVDLVSEDSDRFQGVIQPALPYIHYLFLNEFEAARLTGVDLKADEPDFTSLDRAASHILQNGVREWVFIHFSKGVFARSSSGQLVSQGAVNLPKESVISAVGAGDALAAGILFAIHEGWKIADALRLGVGAAACCLRELSCSEGIVSYKECLRIGASHTYVPLKRDLNNVTLAENKEPL